MPLEERLKRTPDWDRVATLRQLQQLRHSSSSSSQHAAAAAAAMAGAAAATNGGEQKMEQLQQQTQQQHTEQQQQESLSSSLAASSQNTNGELELPPFAPFLPSNNNGGAAGSAGGVQDESREAIKADLAYLRRFVNPVYTTVQSLSVSLRVCVRTCHACVCKAFLVLTG